MPGLTNLDLDANTSLYLDSPENPRLGDGRAFNELLPTTRECAAHLRLLEVFVTLKEEVKNWARDDDADQDDAWSAFVALSVQRFRAWFRLTSPETMRTSLPPLDVLMVWHSFMLNPREYSQFCQRIRPDGAGGDGIPWHLVSGSISIQTGQFMQLVTEIKNAPGPSANMPSSLLDTLKDSEEGSCAKALEALTTQHSKLEAAIVGKHAPFDLAAAVHRQSRFALKMARFGWVHSPMSDLTLSSSVARYGNFFSLFSLEYRQGSSPTTKPSSSPIIVPTVDIDLVWHTHQLSPARYAAFSAAVTGGPLVNHNDNITHDAVSSGFHDTERLYRRVFGEPYALCNSWYSQTARLGLLHGPTDFVVAFRDLVADCSARRNRDLGLSVEMDLAECKCHDVVAGGPCATSAACREIGRGSHSLPGGIVGVIAHHGGHSACCGCSASCSDCGSDCSDS